MQSLQEVCAPQVSEAGALLLWSELVGHAATKAAMYENHIVIC